MHQLQTYPACAAFQQTYFDVLPAWTASLTFHEHVPSGLSGPVYHTVPLARMHVHVHGHMLAAM